MKIFLFNTMKIFLLFPCLSSLMKGVHAAGPLFPELYVFGDSISDGGNARDIAPDFPPNSNGPVAIKYVADALNLTLNPSYHLRGVDPVGTNYAVSGAFAVAESTNPLIPDAFGLPTQVNAFLASKSLMISAEALYVFNIGSNDVSNAGDYVENTFGTFGDKKRGKKSGKKSGGSRRERNLKSKKSSLDFIDEYLLEAESLVKAAVESEIAEISKLASLGAKNFLINTLGDVGRTPSNTLKAAYFVRNAETKKDKVLGKQLTQINQDLVLLYNAYLVELVAEVLAPEFPYAKFAIYDGFFWFNYYLDSGGFMYMNEPCLYIYKNPAYDSPAQNPRCTPPEMEGFFFFDEYHPTTLAHYQGSIDLLKFIMEEFA